ncbi:MAG: SH3 domain-containing protein [Candidatus Latescibacteria bacterium]|nr:SH3 domain-containing protein [Candidatus Latescibacterota bacterium]NIO57216.1 SH3 domain-containing protein [Candidatus Latescibacterota bacterium]
MATDVEKETPSLEETTNDQVKLQAEVEWLLEFKSEKVRGDNLTPCPACTTFVQISANQCPNCDSNIAANNALIRESLRRLEEITAQLDGQHVRHIENHQKAAKRPLRERIKHFFSNPQGHKELAGIESAPDDQRFLKNVREGDHLKVLERCGPWYKVKRRDGHTGWVYSTFVRDR